MRWATSQVNRFARHPSLRKVARTRTPSFVPSHGLSHQYHARPHFSSTVLTSSMQLRSIGGTLAAAAVASGGYWLYQARQTPSLSAADQIRSASTDAAVVSPTTRKALVVDQVGSLYTATVPGDAPLSKDTDDYGRKVLEMLTPEQASAKLRKTEESWIVGRGQGVVRYDVVQIPSNDPIEDDHAEKIIEIPQNLAAAGNGTTSSDWMFWGVFDGHRFVGRL